MVIEHERSAQATDQLVSGAKEGKRFYAFYRGWRDARAGRHENPYPAGTESARHWASGQKYMEDDE